MQTYTFDNTTHPDVFTFNNAIATATEDGVELAPFSTDSHIIVDASGWDSTQIGSIVIRWEYGSSGIASTLEGVTQWSNSSHGLSATHQTSSDVNPGSLFLGVDTQYTTKWDMEVGGVTSSNIEEFFTGGLLTQIRIDLVSGTGTYKIRSIGFVPISDNRINDQYYGIRTGDFEPNITGTSIQDKINSLFWYQDAYSDANTTYPRGGRLSLVSPPNGYTIIYDTESSGPTYGALTDQYEADVIASGGTLSTAAKDAVQALLYNNYDNGAGGTGNVSSLLNKIQFMWAPVSDDFNGVLTCIVGSLTNAGFVSGDYSQSIGITGDGSSYLVTNFTLNDFDNDETLLSSISVTANSTEKSIAGRLGTSSQFMDLRINPNNVLQVRVRDSAGTLQNYNIETGITGTTSAVFVYSNNGVQATRYKGLTETFSSAVSTLPITGQGSRAVSLYGRLNAAGTGWVSNFDGIIRSFVFAENLQDTERNIITRALQQFDVARSNL